MSKIISHESAKDYCAGSRRASGRVHLPIAPIAQARVRFSPEQPLPRALAPDQALAWLAYLADEGEKIRVANLNGPGDPLATPELTLQTLGLLRVTYPDLSICLTTLGLGADKFAAELAKFGLAHVSILMDAVNPRIAAKIYAWIRPGKKTLPLEESTQILIAQQASAIKALAAEGIEVQVKTTVYPGVNSRHVEDIADIAAELGASEMKLFSFEPKGDNHPLPIEHAEPAEMEDLALLASKHLPAKYMDVVSCRDVIEFQTGDAGATGSVLPKPDEKSPNLAVCSSDGFEVDLHLGQTVQFLIYGPKDGPVVLLETRPASDAGHGEARWQQTAMILSDCFAVLTAAAGEAPKRSLSEKGLAVLTQEGNVEGLVDVLYCGKKKGGKK